VTVNHPASLPIPPFSQGPVPSFDLQPRRQIYLGMDPNDRYRRCWASPVDSVGLIGPPRYGKSSGVVIPTLMTWDGPVVTTSTRTDVLRFAGPWRSQLAARLGGRAYVYDPFGTEPALPSVRWSPLDGCVDPATCWRRVVTMTKVVARGGGPDSEARRAGAGLILRGLFHAAALSGAGMDVVRRWLVTQDMAPATQIIRDGDTAGRGWADDLQAVVGRGDHQYHMFSTAGACLEFVTEPRALASTTGTDLDIDHFLRTGSTLFIVAPGRTDVVAPLLLGFLDAIKQRAGALAGRVPGGRLDSPLLLAMDDMVDLVPWPGLPSQFSDGGEIGMLTLWAAQSMAQLRSRFSSDDTAALLSATTTKLIYGGISNGSDLNDVSSWAGMLDRDTRLLPTEAIEMLPPFYAWLFRYGGQPLLVDTRPAGMIESYRKLSEAAPAAGERQ
jgi:type IV secretory pathway TraG/TraD family ATPase VirD4